jgi:hypothetical protein
LAYPILASGQTTAPDPTQLAADQAACQQHAIAYSGYNPAAPPPQQATSPPSQRGAGLRGAGLRGAGLRGAARGAAKGGIAGGIVEEVGDDEKHEDAAEIGAALGTARGASKGIRASRTQAAAAPPPPPAGDPNAYAVSYDDCMSGKGYAKQ